MPRLSSFPDEPRGTVCFDLRLSGVFVVKSDLAEPFHWFATILLLL